MGSDEDEGENVIEGANSPKVHELAEMGRRSRRSSCVSFSISQQRDHTF